MPNGEILRLAIEIEPPFYCDYVSANARFLRASSQAR